MPPIRMDEQHLCVRTSRGLKYAQVTINATAFTAKPKGQCHVYDGGPAGADFGDYGCGR